MATNDKLHRWLDLMAALLRRRYPASFEDLRREVPGYFDPDAKAESVLRMFERDKDELRDLGVSIETCLDAEGAATYRLREQDFYLPLLSLSATALPPEADLRQVSARAVARRQSGELVLTPDECLMLRRAAARVESLANPELTADARNALRKLQFDIGRFAEAVPASQPLQEEGDEFDVLGEALAHRKRVRFAYHAMTRDVVSARTVDPYGLVFVAGHWYLIGRDVSADAVRQFRMSRIREARPENTRKQHPDYAIPSDFALSAYAASRQSWELGDIEATDVDVAFAGDSGRVEQALTLGAPIGAHPMQRRFAVRRLDAFLRWLLSFAGEARPTAPAAVVAHFEALVRTTRARYATTEAQS